MTEFDDNDDSTEAWFARRNAAAEDRFRRSNGAQHEAEAERHRLEVARRDIAAHRAATMDAGTQEAWDEWAREIVLQVLDDGGVLKVIAEETSDYVRLIEQRLSEEIAALRQEIAQLQTEKAHRADVLDLPTLKWKRQGGDAA